MFAFFRKRKSNRGEPTGKSGNRVPPLPKVRSVDELVLELRKTMRSMTRSNPGSWLSIHNGLLNVQIKYASQKLDSLIPSGMPRSRADELKNLINKRFNDGVMPLEELAELLGGEGNLKSVMIAEDKLGERAIAVWADYIAEKPVIDNFLALLSKPEISQNCAGLCGCVHLAVAFPNAKEALAQGSLDIVMKFVESLEDMELSDSKKHLLPLSIYCRYMALELLVLCTSANGLGSRPSTLPALKNSIRDNIASHPEWTSMSDRFMARFVEPESPILLQQRICDALDRALEADPELIEAIFRSGGLGMDIGLNRDTQGGQADYLSMDPIEFEHEVARLLNSRGYRMEVTTASRDGGIDILGFAPGIGNQKVAVQCKRYQGTVGRPDVQQFWGIISGSEYASGFFVTTGSFSADAKQFAGDKPRLVLVDGDELAKWDRE